MEKLVELTSFITIGAAWGLVWIGFLAIFKRDLCSPSALRLISFIFAILGSILAVYLCWNQYSNTNTIKFSGPLIIRLLPLVLLYKELRKSRIVTGIFGLCYVLLPYYQQIMANIG